MRILVCEKQVPDTTEVRIGADYTLERDRVAQATNPADESALELGLSLRDAHGGSVTVLTMGPARAEGMLRDALSRGADAAVHLHDPAFAGADTLATARAISAAAEALGPFDLFLCGRRAVDGETGQVGPMLASLRNIPCVTNAIAVQAEPVNEPERGNAPSAWRISQLTEEGTQLWRCLSPAVITLCEWSYRLRLPTLAGLRDASRTEVRRLRPSDIGLAPEACGLKGSPTRVVRVRECPSGLRNCERLTVEEFLSRGLLP